MPNVLLVPTPIIRCIPVGTARDVTNPSLLRCLHPYHLVFSSQEIDKLLSSIVRRQPGQAPPAGAVPISGRGMPRGMPPGGVGGRGAGPAASAARAAAAGRGNGAGRGPPPPPGADNRPKLRWDQNNEEVEIVIRVDPSECLCVSDLSRRDVEGGRWRCLYQSIHDTTHRP